MLKTGGILAALGLASLVGGMLFFAAVMAPLVFTKLPPEFSGPFIRVAFPRYYAFIIVAAALGALGFLLRGQLVSATVLALVALVTIWLWAGLIPHLNQMREAGNMAAFNRGHRLSVWINGAELISSLWLLIRTAI